MAVNELIEKLKECQLKSCGDYQVIAWCWDENFIIEANNIDIDHKRKEVTL